MPSTVVLKKLSAASGLVFGVFLVLHLWCHFSLAWSGNADVAYQTLQWARTIYQRHPLIELTLIGGSLVVHMVSNTLIVLQRRKLQSAAARSKKNDDSSSRSAQPSQATSLELTFHRYAGYFVAASMVGHISACRLFPLVFLDDPAEYDYSFIAHVEREVGLAFAVYLAVLGMAGAWHLIYGVRSAVAILRGSSVTGTAFPAPLHVVAAGCHCLIVYAIMVVSGFAGDAVDMATKAELHSKVYGGFL